MDGPIAPVAVAAAATAAVAVAFANTMTRSAGPAGWAGSEERWVGWAGSGVGWAGGAKKTAGTASVLVPVASVTRRPASLIAVTCSRHPSSSVTWWPASNSAAPNRQPIAPAPATVIFMQSSPAPYPAPGQPRA